MEIMGCNSSVPDPNVMYGNRQQQEVQKSQQKPTSAKNKVHPSWNGVVQNGTLVTSDSNMGGSTSSITHKDKKDLENRQLKGDRLVYSSAKYNRHKNIQVQMERREKLAQEMCAKAMDEKERFSLSTTRSRATSRAASPKLGHHTQDPVSSTSNVAIDVRQRADADPKPGPSGLAPSGGQPQSSQHQPSSSCDNEKNNNTNDVPNNQSSHHRNDGKPQKPSLMEDLTINNRSGPILSRHHTGWGSNIKPKKRQG